MGGKGMIIALEGIEGAGKTLQARLLSEHLESRGYPCALAKEPSEFLKEAIKGQSNPPEVKALLFAADRLSQFRKVVKPALERGMIVVLDRSVLSSLAYQSAEGVSLEWLEAINRYTPLPDLVIILDVDPRTGLRRIEGRREESELDKAFNDPAFLERVRLAYRQLAGRYSDRVVLIDAARSVRDVQMSIRGVVLPRLKSKPEARGR
jgi:dTMP kinase